MDIYDYLVRDHRKVASMIEQLLDINLQHVQQRFFEDIKAELTLHAAAEEQTFYAALKEAMAAAPSDWSFDHSVHEHDEVRGFLDQLTQEGLTSPKWMMVFGELKHAVEHHVEEEEGHIFALGRRFLSAERAEQLASAMDRRKQELKASLGLHTDHVANA